jgi:hypothetical protein
MNISLTTLNILDKKRERVLRLRNVLRRRQNTVLVGLAPNGGIGIRTLDPLIKSQML